MNAPLPLGAAGARRRREHLREVSRLIRAGRYRVPAEQVADAVIGFHRRER